MEFIDLKSQYDRYRGDIDKRMRAVIEHGRFILGPEVQALEEALANYVGVRHCLTVSSGTDSLEIALRAIGVGPGDEVITVPFTWISTAEAIALVGARPVFVDIELPSFNMNAELIEAAITPRTRAIIPVNLFGQMADYTKINAIAHAHGLTVIEDAAQSFGATQGQQKKSCGITDIGSTSFFPAKPLGCFGDGGALFTNNDQLADKMRAIRVHGGVERHLHTMVGMNGRFDTLQAAVVLAKLPHFDWELVERARIGARYTDLLSGVVTTPSISEGNSHVYAIYTIRSERRDEIAESLGKAGIPSGVYYPKCLDQQPVFAELGYDEAMLPEARKASREVLSIPMHPFLSEQDQDLVVSVIRDCV
jgi:UDP-2-acetamido-2-deoxy-ribo-hexuluronate aminotransferase